MTGRASGDIDQQVKGSINILRTQGDVRLCSRQCLPDHLLNIIMVKTALKSPMDDVAIGSRYQGDGYLADTLCYRRSHRAVARQTGADNIGRQHPDQVTINIVMEQWIETDSLAFPPCSPV